MREIRSKSKLGQYRVAAGMTQTELATHLGCSPGTVHRLETIGTLTRAWAARLSQVLNVSPADLMAAATNVKNHEVMAVRLREARAAAGISSVREASVRLDLPYWKYLNHEQGRQRMKDPDIATYAAAFKVSEDWLRGGDEGGPPRSERPMLLPALITPRNRVGRPFGS
jgi:transcriptional regulator with XRE-family HTH domain